MIHLLNAAVCGFAGAIATHGIYVQSNLLILHDVTRRGRHPLFDPLAFDALGLVWGVVVGVACAVWWTTASPVKAVASGLAITLAGIAVVGGVTTYQRHAAIPRDPVIPGPPLVLELELRLPAGVDVQQSPPTRGALDPASVDGEQIKLLTHDARVEDSRGILPGRVPLRRASPSRLIHFEHDDGREYTFSLSLADIPTEADRAWTGWMDQVNILMGDGSTKTNLSQLRYRVRLASEL